MRNILPAVVAAVGLVGCVGGIDSGNGGSGDDGPGPDPGAQAASRQAFNTNVYPIISAAGRCVTCHSIAGPVGNITGFVATSTADGYSTAVGFQSLIGDLTPAGAPLLTKIAAGHNGQSYTDDEKTKITAWLTAELAARTGGPPGPPASESPGAATLRLSNAFSGCMTLDSFKTANMITFGNLQSNAGACKSCHYNGEYGHIAQDVATSGPGTFFTTITTNRYYFAQYFTVDLSQGVATAKVVMNTKNLTDIGLATAPHTAHGRFTYTNSNAAKALQKFYDLTMTAQTATPSPCGPPTLVDN